MEHITEILNYIYRSLHIVWALIVLGVFITSIIYRIKQRRTTSC